MSLCPTCKSSFSSGEQFCPRDGTPLRAALPDDPLAGRVLSGRYRLVEVLGRGGMGAVYRAHHILMDKPVAVKVLRQELASDTEAVARFHREARSASRLDHDHIIRVTDFGQTDDGLLFLVMELLDGENLAQVLRRGPLPWRRAATIARDIALGLAHAHEQGVIHRDLKPENIVLVRRGKSARQLVKVLDFGLAKMIDHVGGAGTGETAASEEEVAARSLTRTGVVFGTPEYMSPEQAEGRVLGPRTDLYALGVVAYQMVSGMLPFSAPTFLALIAKTVNDAPPLPSQQNPRVEIPPAFEDLVMQCLAKDPEDRPASADEIAEQLDQLLATLSDDPKQSSEVRVAATSGTAGPVAPGSGRVETDAATVEPVGGVAKTVQRNLNPGQVPYGSAPSAVASAYAAVIEDTSRPSASGRPASGRRVAERDQSTKNRSGSARRVDAPSVALPPGPLPPEPVDPAAVSAERLASVDARPDPGTDEPNRSAGLEDEPLVVPRRPYWLIALGLAAVLGVGGYLIAPHWLGKPTTAPGPPVSEEIRKARELLSPARIATAGAPDDAIRLLLAERQTHNSAELQRLLSMAYEAQSNRLRALGHMEMAVRLAGDTTERPKSQLALAQLLARMGHVNEACQAALHVLHERPQPEADLRTNAGALATTLSCPGR